MSKTNRIALTLLVIFRLFTTPAISMLLLDYFQNDFNLPELGYWKCFWLLFLIRMVLSKPYQETRTEWMASFKD